MSGCSVSTMSTLAQLSQPYAGEYRCESLTLGGQPFMEGYEILLTLNRDGAYQVAWSRAGGKKHEMTGKYSFSPDCASVTFQKGPVSRTFSVERGDIIVSFPLHGKLLLAKFIFS